MSAMTPSKMKRDGMTSIGFNSNLGRATARKLEFGGSGKTYNMWKLSPN